MSDADGEPARNVLHPVATSTPCEETVERIGTAIRLGLLAPGSRLPRERDLAAHLQISRGTLSKALATLVQSGYVNSRRGRGGGTFVAAAPPLAGSEVDPEWPQLLRWRAGVEAGVAALAAEHATVADVALLRREAAELEAVAGSDYERFRRADARFHTALAAATGSERLVAEMTELQGRLSELLGQLPSPVAVRHHANQQHLAMVVAVERREVAGAVELMRAHTAGTELILAGLLGEGEASRP